MLTLRPYQQAAVDAVYDYLRRHPGNPLVVLPVGSGKSLVITQIATDAVRRWQGRVLMVTHSAELVQQNADKMLRLCPGIDVGVFCAGLRKKQRDAAIVCASIQSVYRRAGEMGPVDLVIVDEAHAIPASGEGQYRTFLREAAIVCPHLRVIGLTATPYRLASGPICGADNVFQQICYEAGLRELIDHGFLAQLVSKAGVNKVDTSSLRVRDGEFISRDVEQLVDQDALVIAACDEIVQYTRDRQACLIFAASVAHGRHVVRVLEQRHGIECGFVSAETPASERAEILWRFRGERTGLFDAGPLKYCCNVAVLTTGVDVPRIDCIAILRPTASPGLLTQMCGRGTRLHPGKENCLILDFAQNFERHGPLDQIRGPDPKSGASGASPARECPECHTLLAAGCATCPDCGFEFPPPERSKHEATASDTGVLSGQVTDSEYEVRDVSYSLHVKRGADEQTPKSMRVEYRLGLSQWQSEWICFEHSGYARRKAVTWWQARSPDPVPDSAERAVAIAEAGGLARAEKITVRSVAGEPYDRIVRYALGPMPEAVPIVGDYDLEDVPF